MNIDEARILNEALFKALLDQPLTPKTQEEIEDAAIKALARIGERDAIDAINDFTRIKMREDGFFRRILPPLQISNDELDRSVPTDKPLSWLLGEDTEVNDV
jgi:hypothetical protein